MNLISEPTKIIPMGWLEMIGEVNSPLPLEQTRVSVKIVGPLAMVSVEQHFRNPLDKPAEIAYLFPLSDKALLVDFELRISSRVIKGDLQEIETARQTYTDAKTSGKQAALLEERHPNLFSLQIANVRPGESLQTLLTFQDVLTFRDGEYEYVFPMGITPKYHSREHPEEGVGIDAPIARHDECIGKVDISLDIDPGIPLSDGTTPTSPTHKINVQTSENGRFVINLAESTLPDHDFVVRWRVSHSVPVLCGWRSTAKKGSNDKDGDVFFVAVQPPAMDSLPDEPLPREFVFVLDRSGSMSGEPIAQARNALRACLRSLNPQDIFSILLFDDMLEWFRPEPCHASQDSINAADRYLDQVEGRGGTEIMDALEKALALPSSGERMRYLVFLTDGAVSVHQRMFDEVRKKIGKARVFTFGIGPSVNRGLLNRLAKYGKGASDFLQSDEDIEEAILRFQDRISFPALENLSLSLNGSKTWDILPDPMPDLYAGEPLRITGKISSSPVGKNTFSLNASQGGQTVHLDGELQAASADAEDMVQRAWAHAQIMDRLDQMAMNQEKERILRGEIINLSLSHGIASPFTAYVAVDADSRVDAGKPVTIRVSQPLPKGLTFEGSHRMPPPGIAYASAALSAPPMPGIMRKLYRGRPSPKTAMDMSMTAGAVNMMAESGVPPMAAEPFAISTKKMTGDEFLRWLGREQNFDGSWDGNVELTAAALLCFVRSGQTTHAGYFRKQLLKAFQWLVKATASGFAAFAKAAALAELAQATGQAEQQLNAQAVLEELPQPSTPLETCIIQVWLRHETPVEPAHLTDGERLRWAALNRTRISIQQGIKMGKTEQAWQAVMEASMPAQPAKPE